SSFGEAYGQYGDSALLNVVQGDYDRNDPGGVLGTGIVPSGAAAARSQQERTLTIAGRRADVGQAVANGLLGTWQTPGDTAYDIVAGVGGFAVDVGLDPLAWVTGGA